MDDTHHPLLRSGSVPLHQTLGCLNMRLMSRPSCPRAAWLRALSSAGTCARAYAGAHCLALAVLISLSAGCSAQDDPADRLLMHCCKPAECMSSAL